MSPIPGSGDPMIQSNTQATDDAREHRQNGVGPADGLRLRRLWTRLHGHKALTGMILSTTLLAIVGAAAILESQAWNRWAQASGFPATLDPEPFDAWLEEVAASATPPPASGTCRVAELGGASSLMASVDSVTLIDYPGPRTHLAVWHEVVDSGRLVTSELLFRVPFGRSVRWTETTDSCRGELDQPLTEHLQALLLDVEVPVGDATIHRVELGILGPSWHRPTRDGSMRRPPERVRGRFEFRRPHGHYRSGRDIPLLLAARQLEQNHRSDAEPVLLWHECFDAAPGTMDYRLESRLVARFVAD